MMPVMASAPCDTTGCGFDSYCWKCLKYSSLRSGVKAKRNVRYRHSQIALHLGYLYP